MAGKLTRFLNLERPRPPSEDAPRAVANAARFGGEAPLALAEPGEMLCLRCPSCEADNNRVAERCFNCQRALQTAEVAAWNEEYQRQRKAEPAVAEPLPPPSEPLQRAPLWNWGVDERADTTPAGLRLLSLIPDEKRRMAAVAMAATFALSVLLALTASGHPGLRVAGGVVAALLFLLFVPNTRRRRWWDRD